MTTVLDRVCKYVMICIELDIDISIFITLSLKNINHGYMYRYMNKIIIVYSIILRIYHYFVMLWAVMLFSSTH